MGVATTDGCRDLAVQTVVVKNDFKVAGFGSPRPEPGTAVGFDRSNRHVSGVRVAMKTDIRREDHVVEDMG